MKESVKTANPGKGYHGEHPADKADAKYAEMFHKVRKSIVAGNASDKKIKNYLDSTHGRHLVGRENDTEYLHKDFKRFEKTYNPQHFDEATAYKPKVGDRISTIKGGQNTGKVEKVEGSHVYFRSDYKRSTLGRGDDYYPIFKTHVSNVRLHEEVEQTEAQVEGFLSFLKKKEPVKKPKATGAEMRATFKKLERQTAVSKPQQRGSVYHVHNVAAEETQLDERNKANAEAKKRVLRTAGVNAAISGKVPFAGSALQMGRKAAKKLPSKGLAKAYRELPRVAEQMTDNAAITKKTERERRIRDTRVIHHQNRHIHQAAMGTMEESAGKSLADKAKKSGISLATLRKVYNRGVAAWNSGHRPGTTPQQWGHARVNSYITKGKTYHTADKDLRRESVDVNEAFEREFGDK